MNARDQLLEAAFGLFLTHGFDGTGIAAILAETGLSKGAFYHHFASKQALYEEVIVRFFPSPFANLDWPRHRRLEAREQKRIIVSFYAGMLGQSTKNGWDTNRYFALFFDSLSRLPKFRSDVARSYARVIDALATALTAEQGLTHEAARHAARQFIALREGELFLAAIAGSEPQLLQDMDNDDQPI